MLEPATTRARRGITRRSGFWRRASRWRRSRPRPASCSVGWNSWPNATISSVLMRCATGGSARERPRDFCPLIFWTSCRVRLARPPPDGGPWSKPTIAAWMATEVGLISVYPQRAWEALQAIGWSIQAPRPRNPAPSHRPPSRNSPPPSPRKRHATPAGRSRFLHGRALRRAEADHAPGLAAARTTADRTRPSPLRMALRHRLRSARQRREPLVRRQRRLQAALRAFWRCSPLRSGRASDAPLSHFSTGPAGTRSPVCA